MVPPPGTTVLPPGTVVPPVTPPSTVTDARIVAIETRLTALEAKPLTQAQWDTLQRDVADLSAPLSSGGGNTG